MARKSAADIQAKWSKNTKAAGDEMRKGIQAVTEAPGQKAAASVEKMRANLNKSLDDGTWQERVSAIPLEEWKDKMLRKGVPRVSAGVDAAAPKVVQFHQQLGDHQERINSTLDGMPDITLEDGISRMIAQVEGMAQFKFSR